MKWLYEIVFMDGSTENIVSYRKRNEPEPGLLTIYVNPHGHDNRYDEVVIPLAGVRRYAVTEVR